MNAGAKAKAKQLAVAAAAEEEEEKKKKEGGEEEEDSYEYEEGDFGYTQGGTKKRKTPGRVKGGETRAKKKKSPAVVKRKYAIGAEVLFDHNIVCTVVQAYADGTFDLKSADGLRYDGCENLDVMTAAEAEEGRRSFDEYVRSQTRNLGSAPKITPVVRLTAAVTKTVRDTWGNDFEGDHAPLWKEINDLRKEKFWPARAMLRAQFRW